MPQYPFLHPTPYNPGNMGPGSGDMGQLMAMFAGPMLGALAGPGNFVPQLMPIQNVMDGHAMRAYQSDTLAATFGANKTGDNNLATRLLGMRSAVTKAPATDLNREQAQNMAGMLNNPVTKALLGSVVGPENLEAMFHGSKGDVGALAQSVNKIGYFRQDPTGGGRMSAQGLQNYSTGIYNELYEPHGNTEQLAEETRKGNAASTRRLKKAARAEEKEIVSDDMAGTRLMDMDDSKTRVDQLYKKYVSGGKATELKEQAKELTKFDRALNEAGVLSDTEITVGGLKKRADKMATNDMHGFMAGQVGQLAEDMFQRGKLPQALGSMSAADRVKIIQSSGRDEETMDKLARDYGHRELMKDTDYRGKTAEGQKKELESKLGTFKDTLGDTFKELDKAQRGETGAKSVDKLEQLAGMDLMAGNVDAKRSASAIKEMTGAVAAVREIFGDNGNPNAPMPALLAALDQLTQGAGSQVSGGKVETALRQMQTLAKESGVGFEQLAGLSANMGAMGDMLGVANGTTMQSTAHVLAATKVMRDTGAFAKPVYGAMSQEEAMQNVAEREMRGNASTNAMGMATLKALYDASPGKYAGSEMEAAIKAYSDPNSDGSYEYKGEKKNIKEVIGNGGIQAAGEIFERAGGTQSQFSTTYYDPTTKQHVQAGFGFSTQKYEAARDINNAETSNAIHSNMATYASKNAGSEFAKLSKKDRNELSHAAGAALTDLIIETSDMERGDQITHIQKNMEASLTDVFTKRGHPNPAAAAKEAMTAMVGADSDTQRAELQEMIAGANAFYGFQTGGKNLASLAQTDAHGRGAKIGKQFQTSQAIAKRRAEFGGQEAGPLQSMSDYLFEIAQSGENFTAEGAMQATLKSIPDSELRQRYAKEMTGGFTALQNATRDASYTNKDIDDIAKSGDIKKLRELGGMKTDPADKDFVTIYSAAKMTEKRDTEIDAMTPEAVKKAYADHIGGGEGLTNTDRLKELKTNSKFLSAIDSKLLKPNEMTMAAATQKAKDVSAGTAKTPADKARLEDLDKIRASFFKGEDPDKVQAGVHAAIRQFGALGVDAAQAEKLHKLVMGNDEASKEALQKEIGGMRFASEQHKKDFTDILTAQQAGKQLMLDAAGFRPEADKQLTAPSHQPDERYKPDAAPKPVGAGAAAPASAAPAKKQTPWEWLLGLPGTVDPTQEKKEDAALSPPGGATGEVDTPEVAALKKEREAIQGPMSADDAYMARTEAGHAAQERNLGNAKDTHDARKALEAREEAIIAQRTAKKMGISVRGNYRRHDVEETKNGVVTKNIHDRYLGDKLLDPKVLAETEQEYYDSKREGKSPYSPEAQKIIAVDEKLEQAKKKQEEQHAAAVKTANDQAIVQQSTGMSPEDMAAAGEEPTGTTPPSAEQHIPKPKATATDAVSTQTVSSGDSLWASVTKKVMAAANSALGISMPDAKQSGETGQTAASRSGVAAAQTVAINSRNIDPGGAGNKETQKLSISGTLSLQGLTEAIVSARGVQPIATEGGGAPIVMDPPRTPIDNFAPKGQA